MMRNQHDERETPVLAKAASHIKPRDAASLLLIDRTASKPRILMGRRHQKLAFLPGQFVFPGGRIERSDGIITPARDLLVNDADKIASSLRAQSSPRRVHALALGALRETFEETGLRLARKACSGAYQPINDPEWQRFTAGGYQPDIAPLRYVARAITPPQHPRRFDTRFFAGFTDTWPELEYQSLHESGELSDVDWYDFEQARKLDLPEITSIILESVIALIQENDFNFPTIFPVIEYRMRYGRFVRRYL